MADDDDRIDGQDDPWDYQDGDSSDEDVPDLEDDDEDSEEDEEEDDNSDWATDLDNWVLEVPPPAYPPRIDITHNPGIVREEWAHRSVKQRMNSDYAPVDCFSLFWPVSEFDAIATETNYYARDKVAQGKMKSWRDTDRQEIMVFHGMMTFFSIKRHNEGFKGYFGEAPFGEDRIKAAMSQKRFFELLQSFHVSRNVAHPPGMPRNYTEKFSDWYARLNNRTRVVYKPHKYVCTDEGMTVVTSHYCPIKQLMPAKPISKGVKTWSCVDANGVCLWEEVYTGRRDKAEPERHLGTAIIKKVIDHLTTKGHCMVTDNFYGTFTTLRALREAGHSCILMMKKPRKLQPNSKTQPTVAHVMIQLFDDKTPRGTRVSMFYKDEAMITLWRDSTIVSIITNHISNDHDAAVIVKRRAKGKAVLDVPATQLVVKYNLHKSHVDRYNDQRAECDVETRFRRWWMRVFFNGPFARAQINAWRARDYEITSRALPLDHMTLSVFRKDLILWLLDAQTTVRLRASPVSHIPPTARFHRPISIDDVLNGNRTCSVCRKTSKAGFFCVVCNQAYHLNCFFDAPQHLLPAKSI